MRFGHVVTAFSLLLAPAVTSFPAAQVPLLDHVSSNNTVSPELFSELEELARIVDISYCVGLTGTGISKPFECLSRCSDFENFELLQTWNTGPLLSDSCGYIALSHKPSAPRIIVAFRGTYSIANTIADLSTMPQEYIPYPGNDASATDSDLPKCDNCTVHTGFYTSWRHTRNEILPQLASAVSTYPNYKLTLVGHSLGGAVAALASLDFLTRGWDPVVTTFGEPRSGNEALARYLDTGFGLESNTTANTTSQHQRYRRVTHAGDPVPLLPLEEWGYAMHAGEIYISKPSLPPTVADLQHCAGDADPTCIAGSVSELASASAYPYASALSSTKTTPVSHVSESNAADLLAQRDGWSWLVPDRFRLWQLFFAHRDYFWRLGLCVPGGDPFGGWPGS